jgi:AraC-like DNA-binding protein
MAEAVQWLPVQPLHLQLQGLHALGLDSQRVRARLGPLPEAPDALVPVQRYLDFWDEAQALYGLPGLPTALAMAIPFGAFGAFDYLAGSADTVAGCCESAALYFTMVAHDVRLELDPLGDGDHALRVRGIGPQGVPAVAQEFTMAAVFCRLNYVCAGTFKPRLLGLPIPAPAEDAVRTRLYGIAPTYAYPFAEMVIRAETWESPARSADPFLHASLKRLAEQLQLAGPDASPLEQALRVRLRPALAQGRADPARLAHLLGVSERTLQRRLAELGRSFTDVVEDFRREEAMRLLHQPSLALTEVASRLGYAEQTSFTRAFRRWTGTTPGAWRNAR